MSEVRKWLEAIGLAQYAEAFEANNIEADLLGQVEDQTLKDIGVSSAGHRLRIRNAIAKLSPAVPVATNEGAFAPAMEPQARDVAENRKSAVKFSTWSAQRRYRAQGPRRPAGAYFVRLQMVWDNLSCLGTEALARFGTSLGGLARWSLLEKSAIARILPRGWHQRRKPLSKLCPGATSAKLWCIFRDAAIASLDELKSG